jgi:SAM-dependent methyltransferase
MVYLQLAASSAPARSTEFPVLNLEQALASQWDVTIAPGAPPLETIQKFAQLTGFQFGLRMQRVLNDQTKKSFFLEVNRAFKPHVVVFNNSDWPPGSFTTFQAQRFPCPRRSRGHRCVFSGAIFAGYFWTAAICDRRHSEQESPTTDRSCSRGWNRGGVRLFGHPGDLSLLTADLVNSGVLKLVGLLSENELSAFYGDLDCVVHTETFAGWANLAAEALVSGVPLICTQHGTRAFAKHGQTALVLSEVTPEKIGCLLKSLQSDRELQRRLSKNGRKAISRFSWDAYSTELLQLINDDHDHSHYTWAPELGLYGKWPLDARLQGLEPVLKRCAGEKVLDLGAADGLIARTFLEHGAAKVYGVDLDAVRVARARAVCHAFATALFARADLSKSDEFVEDVNGGKGKLFDIVLSLGIHHHLPVEHRLKCLRGAATHTSDTFVVRTQSVSLKRIKLRTCWQIRDSFSNTPRLTSLELRWVPSAPTVGYHSEGNDSGVYFVPQVGQNMVTIRSHAGWSCSIHSIPSQRI